MKASAAAAKWVVTKVVDGDTIWAVRAGVKRKVRLIGIDTPEVGQCGYTEATRNLRGIIGGQPVTLTAGARDDVDRYGRLLRYVDVNGVDAGLRQVEQGYAVARYDSRDGYGRHLRETSYVQSDRSSPRAACAAPVTGRHDRVERVDRWVGRQRLHRVVATRGRHVPVSTSPPGQGQRGLDDRARAGRPVLQHHEAGAVLRLDERRRSSRLPPRQGLTPPSPRNTPGNRQLGRVATGSS